MVSVVPHLSPSIAPKRNYLAVDLTVSLAYREEKSRNTGAYRCRRQLSGSNEGVPFDFAAVRGRCVSR
jgi:hypothetical protein